MKSKCSSPKQYGSWGICFIYGTWFAIRGLAITGKKCDNNETVRKGCDFLLSIQQQSGGWGESYLSAPKMKYVPLEHDRPNLVQTAWAMIGLIEAAGQAERDPAPLHRITGIYLKNCALHYAAYRNIFPLWAVGEYHRRVVFPSKI